MKFLVSTWPNGESRENLPGAAEFASQIAWIRKRLKDGTIDSAFHAPDRAVSIYNAPDLAAVNALIDEIPLSHQMNRKVEPLTDLFEQMEGVLDYLRKRETKS